MASTELLASKIVILEEEPSFPSISSLPSAVLLCEGICERGPIADRNLFTSYEGYVRTHGSFTLDSEVAIAMHGFFYNGGSFAWVSRATHFTDLTDPNTTTATIGSVMLQNSGTASSPAEVTGTGVGPFVLASGEHLDWDIGGGAVVLPFTGTPATDSTVGVGPYNLVGGETILVSIAGGPIQVVTFQVADFAVPGAATNAEVAARINTDSIGASTSLNAGLVVISTDQKGTGAAMDISGGTAIGAAPLLDFTGGPQVGGGNVVDISSVTGLEVEALVQVADPGVDVVVNGTGTLIMQTVATGAATSLQVLPATTATSFGFDNLVHSGADATPEDTLLCEGKTAGSFSDNITIVTEAATSGTATEFNLKVVNGGLVKEVFPNITMDATLTNYVETVINHVNHGSDLIEVTDQLLGYGPLLDRPADGTSSAMVGGGDGLVGIVDADYIGNPAGPTGLYCFDTVNTGRILIVPGISTPAVHIAMLDYAEVHRGGTMFCILDIPSGLTATQAITYVETTASILEYSEYGAVYWPWIKVANPSTSVFGTDSAITVPPSGWVAGKYSSNDQKLGGVYQSPAGIGDGYGIIRGVLGVEDDPTGGSVHEVEDERKRDLVYPKRINPITRFPSTPWHIDGGRTLKSTGNFPNIGERRGVIFIETSLKQGLIVFKHRYNNKETRRQVKRVVRNFLIREMNKDAFRSRNANTAFFVDVSDALNPVANEFAGILTLRIGLATNKPAEYIVVLVTQDTRALSEELAAS